MTAPSHITEFIALKRTKIKRLEELLHVQSKDVGRILDNRAKYNLKDILSVDEEGVHVFPHEFREKRQLTAKGKARAELLKQEQLEWAKAQTCILPPGMTAERLAQPFLIEQFPTFALRGNRWTDEINNALDDMDSIFPRAPFVWPFIGAINAGKTNAMAHVLTVYMHWCFQNIWFVSPTGKLDPTIDTIASSVPPKGAPNATKFTFFNSVPHDRIEQAAQAVIAQNTPAAETAARGKYKENPEAFHRATAALLPAPTLQAPHLDMLGNPVQHIGQLPNEFLSPEMPAPLFHDSAFERRNTHKPFLSAKEQEVGYGIYSDDISKYSTTPWTKPLDRLQGLGLEAPVRLGKMVTALKAPSSVFNSDLYTYWMAQNPYKETLNVDMADFVGGREHAGVFHTELYKNALLVLDDCNQIFGNKSQKNAIKSFITEIRHRHMCMMLGAQKSTLIPREVWAQTIAACIWGTRDERQRKRIQEDYGVNVPNFEWVFDYCTRPDPENGMENPFLYINMATNPPKVYKCFTEEIKWDPNVVEIPKKLTQANAQARMQAQTATQSTTPPRRSQAAETVVSAKGRGAGTSRVK